MDRAYPNEYGHGDDYNDYRDRDNHNDDRDRDRDRIGTDVRVQTHPMYMYERDI